MTVDDAMSAAIFQQLLIRYTSRPNDPAWRAHLTDFLNRNYNTGGVPDFQGSSLYALLNRVQDAVQTGRILNYRSDGYMLDRSDIPDYRVPGGGSTCYNFAVRYEITMDFPSGKVKSRMVDQILRLPSNATVGELKALGERSAESMAALYRKSPGLRKEKAVIVESGDIKFDGAFLSNC